MSEQALHEGNYERLPCRICGNHFDNENGRTVCDRCLGYATDGMEEPPDTRQLCSECGKPVTPWKNGVMPVLTICQECFKAYRTEKRWAGKRGRHIRGKVYVEQGRVEESVSITPKYEPNAKNTVFPGETPPELVVYFGTSIALYEALQKDAEKNFRSPGQQILWILTQHLGDVSA